MERTTRGQARLSQREASGRGSINAPTPPAVDVHNVTVTFRGSVTAVNDVSLHVDQGEVVALLGPNGAGKTTLIDVALGLQKPKAGTAELLGLSPHQAIRRGIVGVVNQTGALPVDMKVRQLLGLFHGFYDAPVPIAEVISATNLDGLQDRLIRKLSGGEQQRVRLALALLPDPLVLFLDEPTSGMDPVARRDFWRVMEQSAGTGRTIIFATHYLAEAETFAERTIIMRDARIVADGPTATLVQQGLGALQIRMPKEAFEGVRGQLSNPAWEVQWSEGVLTIRGHHLDSAARAVLGVPEAHGLRVTDATLEDVFSAIALDDSAPSGDRRSRSPVAARTGADHRVDGRVVSAERTGK